MIICTVNTLTQMILYLDQYMHNSDIYLLKSNTSHAMEKFIVRLYNNKLAMLKFNK